MKSICLKITLSIVLLFNLTFSQNEKFSNNQIIVKFKNSSYFNSKNNKLNSSKFVRLNKINNIQNIECIGDPRKSNIYKLTFSSNDKSIQNIVDEYLKSGDFEYVEPNYYASSAGTISNNFATIPNDQLFSRQWGLYNDGSFYENGMSFSSKPDADVDMELAWDIETGDPNLIIAVPDTGLNLNHEDIKDRIWIKSAEIIDGIDNDGNGLIDDNRGWDWVNGDNSPLDDNGHGTNCTGIIGTTVNNSKGYAGVNWNSKIMPLKVLGSNNNGTYADMASSIYYAVDNGAKIVSMSIGGSSASQLLLDSINYAEANGVLLVFCTMNFNNSTTYYPAGYAKTKSNVIAVGATNSNDARTSPFFWAPTSGSNYGDHITVVAPGNYIFGLSSTSNTGYNTYYGGTSQATPLVAGIASLIKSKKPSITPADIKQLISSTSEDKVGLPNEDTVGWDQYMGWGRVNAYNALNKLITLNNNNFDLPNDRIKLQTNPLSNNEIKLYVPSSLIGNYEVTLIDSSGRAVLEKKSMFIEGDNNLNFTATNGIYILTLKGENHNESFKLIKK